MSMLLDAFKKNCEKNWFGLFIALSASALTITVPIWLGGIRRTPDLRSYVEFAQAFKAAIAAGDILPGWANDNLGFGSVGVRFYPPLASFLAALLQTLTGDWYFAFWLSLFGWMAVGCFGVYLFIKEWGTPEYAICGAILYSIVPFHLAEIYRFFLYAEFVAAAIVPFCFFYLTRVCRRGKWSDVIPLAISFSALILTHLPTTIMTIISLIVYVPLVVDWPERKRIAMQLASSGLLAAAATSFYWVRLINELDWVAHYASKFTIAGSGSGPFLFPNSLGISDPIYASLNRHLDVVILLTTMLLIPFVVLLVVRCKRILDPTTRVATAVTLTAAFGLLMISVLTGFIWSNIGILQRLQFPWRWLTIISILAVVSFALTLPLLPENTGASKRMVVAGVALVVILFVAYDVRQIATSPFRIFRHEFNQVVGDFQTERTSEFWWPVWARAGAFENREQVTAGNRDVQINDWKSERRNFTVGEGDQSLVRIATFYYPHWRARVNGRPVDVGYDESGALTLPVGGERSDIELTFEEPGIVTAASWFSAAVWVFFIGSVGFGLFTRKDRLDADRVSRSFEN